MTTCLGIRNATHWADTRSIERISCSIKIQFVFSSITYAAESTLYGRVNVLEAYRRGRSTVFAKLLRSFSRWERSRCKSHQRVMTIHSQTLGTLQNRESRVLKVMLMLKEDNSQCIPTSAATTETSFDSSAAEWRVFWFPLDHLYSPKWYREHTIKRKIQNDKNSLN